MVCVCGFSSIVDLRERFSKQSSAARAHVLTRSEPGVTLLQRTFLLTFALPLTLLLPDWFVALLVSLSCLSLRGGLPRKGQTLNASPLVLSPFQAVRRVGPPLRATAAARTTRATARARAAPRSTSSPPPAPRASRRPAPRRGRWSAGRSAASHTPASKPWTGRWKRARWPCCSTPNSGARVTCCARSRRAPATPARRARRGRPKRSRRPRRSWKSAFKTSKRSRSRRGSPRGSTCGRPTCWESTACEPGNGTRRADTWGQGSVYMFFDQDFCNKTGRKHRTL